MLTEPTNFGLWITWRGLQCEAAIGLVHPEVTMLQTVLIHEDFVVVEVLTVYTIFADELLEYHPNDEVMKLGQAEGQRLQWRRCQIDIKGGLTCKSRSQATIQIPCSSHSMVHVPSSYVGLDIEPARLGSAPLVISNELKIQLDSAREKARLGLFGSRAKHLDM
jgi:hypothetical protein